ncbi:MAG: hypothetical protein FJX46_00240 [Alphaproteobacteria bacterium]|nr:hypothetical protein [Alphaproteobacteria bacterium]
MASVPILNAPFQYQSRRAAINLERDQLEAARATREQEDRLAQEEAALRDRERRERLETQRAEELAAAEEQNRKTEATLQEQAAEDESRRLRLASALSSERARMAAQGLDPHSGSARTVLRNLIDENERAALLTEDRREREREAQERLLAARERRLARLEEQEDLDQEKSTLSLRRATTRVPIIGLSARQYELKKRMAYGEIATSNAQAAGSMAKAAG